MIAMALQSRPQVLLSLITADTDYQLEQAASAERVAAKLGLAINIEYADSDGVYQSLQILKVIQSEQALRPDAVMVEPVGTSMVQVAQAAVKAGIGWVILNRDADYLTKLRSCASVPIFGVSTDNDEVGRIQGKQISALTPPGGCVLYLEGPSGSDAARHRTQGLLSVKRADITLKHLRGGWTEAGACHAIQSWLLLGTARQVMVDIVVCQNDTMAMGARKAFEEITDAVLRERFLALPFIGCDGVPGSGQAHVRRGLMKATVITPPLTGIALEMLAHALRSQTQPPEQTLVTPQPFPPVESLQASTQKREIVRHRS
jgi:ribose transport system substrate-binding protein